MLTLAATLLLSSAGWTKVEYDSNQLMMKNAEQISELVRKKIKRAQEIQAKQENNDDGPFVAEPEAIEQLQNALRILLSRPDQDGTRANAFSRLRRELIDLNSLEPSLEALTRESISTLKDEKTKPLIAGTYIILLGNLMAEMKPEIKTNAFFKRLIEEIRDANIKISDATKNQVFMRTMGKPSSPSEQAAKIAPRPEKK